MSVADWLKGLDLGQYAQAFAENDVDLALAATLTDADFKDIGVAALGHRRKLLAAAATLAIKLQAPERRPITVMFCDLANFVGRELTHPTRTVPDEVFKLVQAYEGLTDEAYPGPERWQQKDKLFEIMRKSRLVAQTDSEVLLRLGGTGFHVAAIASMIQARRPEHLNHLSAIADSEVTVNLAYKVYDYLQAYLDNTGNSTADHGTVVRIVRSWNPNTKTRRDSRGISRT